MIRIGIVGAGPNGSGNAKKLALHDARCRIAAVADPNAEAAAKLAGVYGARPLDSLENMLDEVDAVVISSPNFLHTEQAVAAASAGKHVWIEKPMALSVADADRIVAAVEKAGVASMIGFSVRFDPVVRAMKKQFDDGALGPLLSVWSRRLSWFDPARMAPWRAAYDTSGGVMAELLAHEIDWIVDIAGPPKAVYCRAASRRHDHPRANDHIWLTLAFDGEATGTIEGSMMARIADYERGLLGADGSAATRAWGNELYVQRGSGDAVQIDPGEPFDKHGHFLDVIEGTATSVADVAWGRSIVEISERALSSAESGQVVSMT